MRGYADLCNPETKAPAAARQLPICVKLAFFWRGCSGFVLRVARTFKALSDTLLSGTFFFASAHCVSSCEPLAMTVLST